LTDLEIALRAAVEDAVVGEPMSPRLAGVARSAVLAELHRQGVRGLVEARVRRGGVQVTVVVEPGTVRVRRVVIQTAGD